MKKVLTAKEFLKQLDGSNAGMWTEDDNEICKAFILFAQMYVEDALLAVRKSVKEYQGGSMISHDLGEAITRAYPLENIK